MSQDFTLGFVNDLMLMNPDSRHMMQWLKWCPHFSIPTGK